MPNRPRASTTDPAGVRAIEPARLEELVRVRWASLSSQLLFVLGVRFGLEVPVPLASALGLIVLAGASNVALAVAARRAGRAARADRLVGPTLLLDTALLTALLYVAGGASNPFSVLYLVQVTLAAVSASRRWTFGVVLASVAGYALLFLAPELPGMAHGMHAGHAGHAMHAGHTEHGGGTAAADPFSAHLQGMWLAFALAAALIAYFVSGVARSLLEERERAARSARLVALSTLAAGAAHELLTPLGTIKIAAAEIERALEGAPDLEGVREDARLVTSEVERSRAILDRLRGEAGELAGEPVEVITLSALEADLRQTLGASAERIVIKSSGLEARTRAPRRALAFALASLVRNALDASEAGEVVEVELDASADGVRVVVRDRGRGMSDEELARAGEPFFTTKEPGRGMGLGLFIARSLVEQLGGALALSSRAGSGTTATVHLPPVPGGAAA